MRLSLLGNLLALAGISLTACGGGSASTKGGATTSQPQTMANKDPALKSKLENCDENGKKIVKLDINHDDRTDVWKLFVTTKQKGTNVDVLVCKKVDLNHDGTVDMVVAYDDQGIIQAEQFDLDFDKKFDQTTYYDHGVKLRVEWDSTNSGGADIVDHYRDGKLDLRERDTDGDGKPDYWERYKDGQVEAIGYDDNKDGKVDRWEQAEHTDTGETAPVTGGPGAPAKKDATDEAPPAPKPEDKGAPAPTPAKKKTK